jgi:hypothetical protein
MYRATATICGDNQGGDGGFESYLFMRNTLVCIQRTDQGGVSENDRESHTLIGVQYMNNGDTVSITVNRYGAGGGQTDISDSYFTFELMPDVSPASQPGTLEAVISPSSTLEYQIYKKSTPNSDGILLGNGDSRSSLVINELSYSAFNPAPAYAQFGLSSVGNTNIGINDHIKFDTVKNSSGMGITLDTAAYPALGRVTLQAGRTYKLEGSINSATFGGTTGYIFFQFYDVTNGVYIGNQGYIFAFDYSGNQGANGIATGYIKPGTSIQIELRFPSLNLLTSYPLNSGFLEGVYMNVEVIEANPKETPFSGASAGADGTEGLVPAPLTGEQNALLKGDSTWLKNNFTATTDPTTSDDQTQGYGVGSTWINTADSASKVYTLSSPLTSAARWIMTPILVYSLEAVNVADNASTPQNVDLINLQYLSTTGGSVGFRNYNTGNAIPNTSSYPNLTNAYQVYDPYGVRGTTGNSGRDQGHLFLVDKLGAGLYHIEAQMYRAPNDTNLRFSTNSLTQSGGGGNVNIGIQVGQTGTVSAGYGNDPVQWGGLVEGGVGVPEYVAYTGMKMVNIDPLRFIVSLAVGDIEETYFKFNVIKYS